VIRDERAANNQRAIDPDKFERSEENKCAHMQVSPGAKVEHNPPDSADKYFLHVPKMAPALSLDLRF